MLTVGQIRAIKDSMGFNQGDMADAMGISRPALSRMLKERPMNYRVKDKYSARLAGMFPGEVKKWVTVMNMTYLEKLSQSMIENDRKKSMPVATVKTEDKVKTIKRKLFGILEENKPIDMKLNDDLFATIVNTVVEHGGVR